MRNIFLILTALMLSIFYSCNKDKKALSLPAIFSDNLVLQQNTEAAVWGKATAGSKIINRRMIPIFRVVVFNVIV